MVTYASTLLPKLAVNIRNVVQGYEERNVSTNLFEISRHLAVERQPPTEEAMVCVASLTNSNLNIDRYLYKVCRLLIQLTISREAPF